MARAHPETAAVTCAGMHVLLVEDEYLLALYLQEIVEQGGAHAVGPVSTVREALDMIEGGRRIDAAVLDINLGGEPVFPVAAALRSRGVPFLFVSGYDPATLPEHFRDVQVCAKPIDARAVSSALAGLPASPAG